MASCESPVALWNFPICLLNSVLSQPVKKTITSSTNRPIVFGFPRLTSSSDIVLLLLSRRLIRSGNISHCAFSGWIGTTLYDQTVSFFLVRKDEVTVVLC